MIIFKYKDISLPVISIVQDYLFGYPFIISNIWSNSLLSFITHIYLYPYILSLYQAKINIQVLHSITIQPKRKALDRVLCNGNKKRSFTTWLSLLIHTTHLATSINRRTLEVTFGLCIPVDQAF